jgi:flavin reductase (DIM6/NTAB) family NADH-FMN oxidoreductase RutF
MKGEPKSYEMALQPLPQVIVSVRDKEGRNNALAVGYTANVSHDPAMIMVGIEPTRFSHHMVKENGCFVVNLPLKSFRREFGYLGSKSGRDGDKFAALDLKWEDGKYVNAPVLTDCPVNIECSVVESIMPGSNELFIGKVEIVHVDEEYLDKNGNILWRKMDLI